jgi:4-hydroxyphenylacetate 3-monooxygenase
MLQRVSDASSYGVLPKRLKEHRYGNEGAGKMPKTGADHLNSLRDGRAIYLDGQRIPDVVEHPAYRNAIRSTAYLYDFQAASANLECMTFPSPTTGDRVNRCWQLPCSYTDLIQRRKALTAWAETTYGFMGRSPDHVASCLSGMVMGLEVFERYSPDPTLTLARYIKWRSADKIMACGILAERACM